MCLVEDFILASTFYVFFGFVLLTLKLYLKRITFELHSKISLTVLLGLVSRSQHKKLIFQVDLVLVCNILAEVLLGNDKATY